MSIQPSIAIVIPCLNEQEYIAKCLDSIVAQDYPANLWKVYVVDGRSTDATRDIVSAYTLKHPITLVDNPQKVTPVALNLGIKSAAEEVIMILGAHAELYPDHLTEIAKYLQRFSDAGCVGGIIENVYESRISQHIGWAMSSSFGVGNAHFRTGNKDGYVDTVAFGAYRREVFEKAGYFDEELVRNQDDEFNFRIQQHGFKIYLAKSIRSRYFVRGSYSKLFKQYFQYGYWKVYVNKKHSTITTVRQTIPALFVLFIFGGFILSFLHPILALFYFLAWSLYVFAGLFAAVNACSSPLKTPFVWWAFFILHLSYGSGYLEGIWHFIILGKQPAAKHAQLSR
jgi:glycosyltransferase involved in cell wall biosynthesis